MSGPYRALTGRAVVEGPLSGSNTHCWLGTRDVGNVSALPLLSAKREAKGLPREIYTYLPLLSAKREARDNM